MLLATILFSIAAILSGAVKAINQESGGRFILLADNRDFLEWLIGSPEYLENIQCYAPRTPQPLRCAASFFHFLSQVVTVCAIVAYVTAFNIIADMILLFVCKIIAQHFATEYLFTLDRRDASAIAYFKRTYTPKFFQKHK
jgi:hypothetical protein